MGCRYHIYFFLINLESHLQVCVEICDVLVFFVFFLITAYRIFFLISFNTAPREERKG
jgi:hypothetical protein